MSRAVVVSFILLSFTPGCATVERRMFVTSDPPGALVYMNDQEIGRTPVERDFTWYGVYDVQVRKDGYDTKVARTKVIAPLWQWPPFDFFVELTPVRWRDRRQLHYKLTPTTAHADPELMLSRAEKLRILLEGSPFTKNPAAAPVPTQPTTTTAPSTATSPASEPSTAPPTTAPTTRPGSFL